MHINFENHILELLKNNECVVLPGFGGFILKSIPSTIHQQTIYPSSKQIAFNASLIHDDELLTGALMGRHTLAYEDAKNKVLAFSNELKFSLKKNKTHSLKKIGSFVVNDQGRIVFKPFVVNLADKEAFGFRQFHAKPIPKQIIRKSKKSAQKKIEKVQAERKERKRKISKLPVVGLVSSVLLIGGILGLMGTQTNITPAKTQQAGFVDMLFPKDSFINSFENTESWNEVFTNTPVEPKEGYINGSLIEIGQKDLAKGYYIVVGSYASRKNAERKEAELFANGKDSYIFPSSNGFFRVGFYADAHLINAKNMLEANSLAPEGAWLLKN